MVYIFCYCVNSLCTVKYDMSDKVFQHKYEIKMHICGISYSLAVCTLYQVFDFYNNYSDASICFATETPIGCHADPDVKCVRAENASTWLLWATYMPNMILLLVSMYCLAALYIAELASIVFDQKHNIDGEFKDVIL